MYTLGTSDQLHLGFPLQVRLSVACAGTLALRWLSGEYEVEQERFWIPFCHRSYWSKQCRYAGYVTGLQSVRKD